MGEWGVRLGEGGGCWRVRLCRYVAGRVGIAITGPGPSDPGAAAAAAAEALAEARRAAAEEEVRRRRLSDARLVRVEL